MFSCLAGPGVGSGRRREETEMPKEYRERTRKARALMQQRPELNYTQTLAEVDAEHGTRARGIDPALLAPYPDETGVTSKNSAGGSCPLMPRRSRRRAPKQSGVPSGRIARAAARGRAGTVRRAAANGTTGHAMPGWSTSTGIPGPCGA